MRRLPRNALKQKQEFATMNTRSRKLLSSILAAALILQTSITVAAAAPAALPQTESMLAEQEQKIAADFTSPPPLQEVEQIPSLEVAALAVRFNYNPKDVQARIKALKNDSKAREQSYSDRAKASDQQVEAMERQLAQLPTTQSNPQVVAERRRLQCEIVMIKQRITDEALSFMQEQIGRDVRIARLNLLAEWKGEHQKIQQQIANGAVSKRRFGNVLDIGHRGTMKPFAGQQQDVDLGQREIQNARQRGRLPKELQDTVVREYVVHMAQSIAQNSDLQVPLHVYVVAEEVRKDGRPVIGADGQPEQVTNAMALPGGFIFVYAGLILAAQNPSELAGVVGHEIAHVTARHSARMMSKGTKFGILQMATVVGLSLVAPGLFQAGSYLASQLKGLLLQSIMNGLGLVFTVNALGVSRDSELEADQLGMQYAWKAGYDPRGIISFFDWMAMKSGHASRTSFFATHPAFGDRTLSALKEYTVLRSLEPNKVYNTDIQQFGAVKAQLKKDLYKTKAQIRQEETSRPSLKNSKNLTPEGCASLLSSEAPATHR
jgi:beta-barrel assembly-enhancing protease